MKAILVDPTDRSLSWSEVPDPVLHPGEVLVKVAYAGVNRADLLQREGTYPPPPGCPDWMGLEISGTVAELSPEARAAGKWHVGERVCALLGGGGYAEYVAVPAQMLMPVPEGIGMEMAAALPEACATAYLNLKEEGDLRSGDVFLMHAGSSGLASVVIPMAKAMGATVITTIRDEAKRATVARTGADVIVNTRTEDIVGVLRDWDSRGRPVQVALDCLGGEVMGKCLPYMGYMSKWIMIATLAGDRTEIDMRRLYVRNVRIVGSTLRSKPEARKAEILARLVAQVWPLVTCGRVRPVIDRVLPITEAEEAHRRLSESRSAGKVVLRVDCAQTL